MRRAAAVCRVLVFVFVLCLLGFAVLRNIKSPAERLQEAFANIKFDEELTNKFKEQNEQGEELIQRMLKAQEEHAQDAARIQKMIDDALRD